MSLATLDQSIRAVCPIEGVSVGRWSDKATWRIDIKDEATPAQRTAAQAALSAFDVPASLNPSKDDLAAAASDAIDRLQFEILFGHENRIRALEGKAAITRVQYRGAVINLWKSLNP